MSLGKAGGIDMGCLTKAFGSEENSFERWRAEGVRTASDSWRDDGGNTVPHEIAGVMTYMDLHGIINAVLMGGDYTHMYMYDYLCIYLLHTLNNIYM